MDEIHRLERVAPAKVLEDEDRDQAIARERSALVEAEPHIASGSWAAAEALLLPFAPSASEVRTLTSLARIYAATGRVEDAIAVLKAAEKLSAFDKKVWGLMARMLAAKGRTQEEVVYRRQLSYFAPGASAHTFVDLLKALIRSSPRDRGPASSEVKRIIKDFKAASDVDDEQRMRFSEVLYGLPKYADVACEIYREAAPCPASLQDARAEWVRMTNWCAATQSPLVRMADGGTPGHRPTVMQLRDVAIFPAMHWIPVLDGGRAVMRGLHTSRRVLRSSEPLTPLLLDNSSSVELRLPREMRSYDHPALLMGGSQSYYAHITEHLGALAVAEIVGLGADLPIVVNDDLADFQMQLFELLGIGMDRLVRVTTNEAIRFANLTVPSRLVVGNERVDPLLPQWCRQRFQLLSRQHGGHGRRLYVTREGEPFRRVTNESEVRRLLISQGFEVLTPRSMTVREQIDQFAEAELVVGVTDPALTNVVFAQPGTRVVELQGNNWLAAGGQMHFGQLADASGHAYSKLSCVTRAVAQHETEADLTVNLDQLLAAVS